MCVFDTKMVAIGGECQEPRQEGGSGRSKVQAKLGGAPKKKFVPVRLCTYPRFCGWCCKCLTDMVHARLYVQCIILISQRSVESCNYTQRTC